MEEANVYILTTRINVQWGSFRIVEATVELIKAALKHDDIAYLHLMSGECLHVKPISFIHDFFNNNQGKQFIHFVTKSSKEYQNVDGRMNKYHFHNFFNPRSKSIVDLCIKYANSGGRKVQGILKHVGIYRRYPDNFPQLFKGKAWWSLTTDACKYIIQYIESNKSIYRRFQYTQLPDESFFQTVIMNSPFALCTVNDSLRFDDIPDGQGSPVPLQLKHLPAIKNDRILFARKITENSRKLLTYLNNNVYCQAATIENDSRVFKLLLENEI